MNDVQQGAIVEKDQNPIVEIRAQLKAMDDQFKAALPAHIPVDRFARVVMTAIQNAPDLIAADRRSLWNAAMRAAQDGLLPDGREGAIVTYNTKTKVKDDNDRVREVWIKKAQWMPMVFGIMKKARNSGEIASITARVVYEGDQFRYWIDDAGEHVMYEPSDNPNIDVVRRVFAMAKTKDGAIYVEPLTPADIEKIRSVSRAKDNGPWVDWWGEMAKKSAIRRLSKRLPMSTDLDDLIRRDDDLYDFEGARSEAGHDRTRSLAQRLDALAALPAPEPSEVSIQIADEPATGSDKPPGANGSTQQAVAAASGQPAPAAPEAGGNPEGAAHPSAQQAGAGTATAQPKNAAEYEQQSVVWIENAIDPDALEKRWREEKGRRNSLNVDPETRDELAGKVAARAKQLRAAKAKG